jgi:hypothetical protein
MKIYRKVIVLLLISIFILLIVGLYSFSRKIDDTRYGEFTSNSFQPVPTDMSEISAIEGNAEIKIPVNARNIYALTTGFRDIDIFVRLDIEPDELPEFMQNTICDNTLIEIDPKMQKKKAMELDWWVPNNAKILKSCTGIKTISQNQHIQQSILIDMTNPMSYIVYVSTNNS